MIIPKQLALIISLIVCCFQLTAKDCKNKNNVVQGKLTPLRTCFDVKHYDVAVTVNPEKKSISGSNNISFKVEKDMKEMQIDFTYEMQIDSIVLGGNICQYKRDSNAIFVQTGLKLKKGSMAHVIVYFSGNPHIAKKAPWDGGFVWSKDSAGSPWVGLACEGIGPSIWLPCKDHWSDEADSMDMHLTVPEKLTGVSNGKLVGMELLQPGWMTYHWKVVNPINTYSISINVANYALITDSYVSPNPDLTPLTLSYYVLNGNERNAKVHFNQVKTMLACNENFFGPYPFWSDGYKLVETPYWGMEHQSCVAYGNHYKNNAYGFDFIIIHESAHEWFANSVTASDPADMWIHESFTTYAEALYVEYTEGYDSSLKYLGGQRKLITSAEPMIGPYGVYYHGRKDNDIYYKGTWILHTMRNVIDNDSIWFAALKGFYQQYTKQIINTRDVIRYFNTHTGRNWDPFFKQYLYSTAIPEFEYRIKSNRDGSLVVQYRWRNVVKGFEMPVKATMTKEKWETITPLSSWQLIDLNYFDEKDFKLKFDCFLISSTQIGLHTFTK